MPNWCTNKLYVAGPKEDLDRFFEGIQESEDGELSIMKSYLPMPEELHGTKSPGDEPNWYDWQLENWGCKWGDCDLSFEDQSEDYLIIEYDTPWGPCNQGILGVAKLFPTLFFEVEYYEEGMNFRGRFVCEEGMVVEDESWEMTDDDLEDLGLKDEDWDE